MSSKLLKKLIKGTAAGGLTGFIAAKVTSSTHEADENSTRGMQVGVLTGVGIALAPKAAKTVFRRIRGRIIPIKVK